MLQPADGKVGTRELFAIFLISIGIKLSDGTPMLLLEAGKNATWVLPIVAGGIILVPTLLILSLLKKYKNKNLVDIIFIVTGKYIGFIICLIILFAMIFANALNQRTTVNIISTMFFPTTPVVIIFLLLIGSSFAVARVGIEAVGRTAWVVLPYIKVVLFLLFLLIINEIHFEFLFPIAGPGLDVLIKESFSYHTIFFEFIMVALFFPWVRDHKSYKTATLLAVGFIVLEMTITMAYFVMLFDYPQVAHVAYPFQQLTKMLEVGTIVTSYEGFFLGFWIMAAVVRFSIYLLLSAFIVCSMFQLKDFKPILLPLACITLLVGLIPENQTETTFFMRDVFLLQSSWYFVTMLPILLWITYKVKERFNV
ncbi:GerAB/ArcD/ProY family transporter [Alkalihalobacterium chitinilyticum]|uniref:Spore germination protein n=1 Tax=Alkalihalobacterium chitinilyticum TaxID=2980103 RepID=A0ABT5VLR3_9BACI|nr:endospore germination permease [Alkalihalobacterium chitinilyticum]MDE5415423.1 spore germination protein [Alkalihalobacterium chitinilyticum]